MRNFEYCCRKYWSTASKERQKLLQQSSTLNSQRRFWNLKTTLYLGHLAFLCILRISPIKTNKAAFDVIRLILVYKAGQHFRNSSRDWHSGNFIVCVQKRDRPPVLLLFFSLRSSFRTDFVYPLASGTDALLESKLLFLDKTFNFANPRFFWSSEWWLSNILNFSEWKQSILI